MLRKSPNPSATLVRDVGALSDGSANNLMALRAQIAAAGTAAISTSVAGAATASGSLGTAGANAVSKIGGVWNGSAGIGALNGGVTVSYAASVPTGIATLTFGNDYSGAPACLNGLVAARPLLAAGIERAATAGGDHLMATSYTYPFDCWMGLQSDGVEIAGTGYVRRPDYDVRGHW